MCFWKFLAPQAVSKSLAASVSLPFLPMATAAVWVPRQRAWREEADEGQVPVEDASSDHPLLGVIEERERLEKERAEQAKKEEKERREREKAREKAKKEKKKNKKKKGGLEVDIAGNDSNPSPWPLDRALTYAEDFDPLSGDPLGGSDIADPFASDYPTLGVTSIKSSSTTRSAPALHSHTTISYAHRDDYADAPVWKSKKGSILSKYTTNEAIPVPSFVKDVGPKGSH